MIGSIVFLPPLLTESLLPPPANNVYNNISGVDAAVTASSATLDAAAASMMDAGQLRVTAALAIFGGSGIAGNLGFGLAMTFGPLANQHFTLFVANNVVLLVAVGKIRVISR